MPSLTISLNPSCPLVCGGMGRQLWLLSLSLPSPQYLALGTSVDSRPHLTHRVTTGLGCNSNGARYGSPSCRIFSRYASWHWPISSNDRYELAPYSVMRWDRSGCHMM